MPEKPNYELLLYNYLQAIAPVTPGLWKDILSMIDIKISAKKRNLLAQQFDLHIVLEGMVIKRRDEDEIHSEEVADFISNSQCIYHIEQLDKSYFETDCHTATALLRQEVITALIENHPIFKRHACHFFADVLKRRSFKGKLVNQQALEKKALFKKEYPDAYRSCAVKDKSSFLGMTPTYYSSLDI